MAAIFSHVGPEQDGPNFPLSWTKLQESFFLAVNP